MRKIKTYNNISPVGLSRLPADFYEVGPDVAGAEAIILRSANLHEETIPETVKAIGRAGAGVNNIPVDDMTQRGIAVFNAPGANANAVKELVIAGLLLGCRNICQAWDYVNQLDADDESLKKLVEDGKKKFAGFELPGRTIGVVGLGAIGRSVANVCLSLGMDVIGYDPSLTVEGAWKLSSSVQRARDMKEVLRASDFITFHVPLNKHTRDMIDMETIGSMKPGMTVLNFARDGIVNDQAAVQALEDGQMHAYICDFPSNVLKDNPKVIALPHLGASTREAEENCAIMVADEIRDYLENGNVVNSVNFPEVVMPRGADHRLAIANLNVPNMLGQISTLLANAGINISDMINQSRGDLAYTLVDADTTIPASVVEAIDAIDGVLFARTI